MDCYVDKSGRVWLLDFSPWGPDAGTESLLFRWEEFDTSADDAHSSADDEWPVTADGVQLRWVRDAGVRPPAHLIHKFPTDLLRLGDSETVDEIVERLKAHAEAEAESVAKN